MSKDGFKKPGFELDVFVLPDPGNQRNEIKPPPSPKNDVDPNKIIQLILKKIKKNDSLLTFTNQINEVNKILQMKYASANDIAQVILNDVPLTSKLLKLVNSSFYNHFSPNGFSTITEAMIIVGTDQIKFLAAGLKLIELMQNIGDSNLLKEKILKSIQRSIIAVQIAKKSGFVGSEKLQICSVLYDFGEYLVTAFVPNAYKKVKTYQEQKEVNLEDAAKAVIGISYKDIGLLVVSEWNMPKTITNAMKPIKNYHVKKSDLGPEDSLAFLCSFANDLCDISLGEDKNDVENKLKKIQEVYAGLFEISTDNLVEIIKSSEEKIAVHSAILKVAPKTIKNETETCIKDSALIENGIDQIKQKFKAKFTIQEIFESALQCLYDGFRFGNVNFCIRNRQTETMNPRYVLGPQKESFFRNFKFKILKANDLFNKALHNESIIIVDNLKTSPYKNQIPLWYKENGFSDAFAVVPIGLDGKIVSMFYLDWNPDKIRICDETKAHIETFRKLVIEALKRRG